MAVVVQAQPVIAVAVAQPYGQPPPPPGGGGEVNVKGFHGVTMSTPELQKDFEMEMKSTFASMGLLLVSVLLAVIGNGQDCDTCSAGGGSPKDENPCQGRGEDSTCSDSELRIAGACSTCDSNGFLAGILISLVFIAGLYLCSRNGPRDRNTNCMNFGLCGHGMCLYCSCCCGAIFGAIGLSQSCDGTGNTCGTSVANVLVSVALSVSSALAFQHLNKVKGALSAIPNFGAGGGAAGGMPVAGVAVAQPVRAVAVAQPVRAQVVQAVAVGQVTAQPVRAVAVAVPVSAAGADEPPPYEDAPESGSL